MTPSARPPLKIGQLISAALAKVWHFKLELGLLWLGLFVSSLVLLPFARKLQGELAQALQPGAHAQTIAVSGSTLLQVAIVTLLVVFFQCGLLVLWLRLLRLGTVLAFEGGLKMLATRTAGLFLRCVALFMVCVGGILIFAFIVNLILRSIFGTGTTIAVPSIGAELVILIVIIAIVALTIRVSFALISPVFDAPVPVERAWALIEGNTLRIMAAIFAACFPVVFAGSLLESAILRIGPATAQQATAAAAAAVAQPGTGVLLGLSFVSSVTNCLEIALATAILIEAFDQLDGWGRGRIVSQVV